MTAYQPRRNLVRRELDGKTVNVARARGQLFVCADACCCGRADLTNAPVPRDLYHEEWMRRRLRNFVHLTIGGCLGPCALANVAMLVFDGRTTWFHSMNDSELVVALFDHIESLLDGVGGSERQGRLAELQFSGYEWESRPDRAVVEDHRVWRGRSLRPDSTPACEIGPEAFVVVAPDEVAVSAAPATGLTGDAALPRANGELVFQAPWEGRAFGMATALVDDGAYAFEEFRQSLIAHIGEAEQRDEPFDYYTNWLAAFERLLAEKGLVSAEELAERTAEFEFGERQDVY